MYDPLFHAEPSTEFRGPLIEPLIYRPPKAMPTSKPVSKPVQKQKPSTRSASQQAKQQPRDWHGRFASIGRGLKKIGKRIKKARRTIRKIRRSLSPKYRVQRVQRTRRANQRQNLRRQGYTIPKRRPQRRRSVKHMPRSRVR